MSLARLLVLVLWLIVGCRPSGSSVALDGSASNRDAGAPIDTAMPEAAAIEARTIPPLARMAPLDGKQIGLLVTDLSVWGPLARFHPPGEAPGNDARVYMLSTDYRIPQQTYVTGAGDPAMQTISAMRVTLADGGETIYRPASLFSAKGNAFGLSAEAHLAEIEVNGGGGAGSTMTLVVTRARVVDGTADYPIVPSRAIDAARARFNAFVSEHERAIAVALESAAKNPSGPRLGEEHDTLLEAYRPAWMTAERVLRVHHCRHLIRTSSRQVMSDGIGDCRPNSPSCHPGPPQPMTITHGYGIEIGEEIDFDVRGAVTAERAYEPRPLTRAQLGPLVSMD